MVYLGPIGLGNGLHVLVNGPPVLGNGPPLLGNGPHLGTQFMNGVILIMGGKAGLFVYLGPIGLGNGPHVFSFNACERLYFISVSSCVSIAYNNYTISDFDRINCISHKLTY